MRYVLLALVVLGAVAFWALPGTDPTGPTGSAPTPTPTLSPIEAPEPSPSVDLTFAVVGDFGTGEAPQESIAARMCRFRKRHPFDLVITTGDNVYPDGHPGRFDAAFRDPYACLLDAGVRFRSSLGNHDIMTDSGEAQVADPDFGYRAKRKNYVVRNGGVRFVIADGNALDRSWLNRALPPATGDRWTIVAFHQPVYSPGLHGSTPGFEDLPKIFQRHGVDLVLNGHDHLYAVSRNLNGIRYIVTGGGGAPPYDCREAWFSKKCDSRHHFLWVRATDDAIVIEAVPASGEPFHRFRTSGRA